MSLDGVTQVGRISKQWMGLLREAFVDADTFGITCKHWFVFTFKIQSLLALSLRKKCSYSEFFWSVFSAFGLNTERYEVSLRIQSKYGKIRSRKTPNTDTFHVVSTGG